ncbi:MAG: aldo/keto reductase [Christensenellales bacterium]
MRFKRFGKIQANLSVMTVGTWAIGGQNWGEVNKEDSVAAIGKMLENGINSVDTAPAYGMGYAEELLGEVLSGYQRSELFITTKAGLRFGEGIQGFERDVTYDSIMQEIDDSLRRLKMDYVDLYLVHKPDFKNTPCEETMRAMVEIQQAGKARFIGLSNYPLELMQEMEKYGEIAAIQPPYSMVDRSEQAVIDYAKSKDIAVMSYGSLGAGILTGAIRELPRWTADDARYTFYNFFVEPRFSRAMKLLETLDKIAAERSVPVAQVAINWNTQHPQIDTALFGVRNVGEAEENCAAMAWELTSEEIAAINEAIRVYDAE